MLVVRFWFATHVIQYWANIHETMELPVKFKLSIGLEYGHGGHEFVFENSYEIKLNR